MGSFSSIIAIVAVLAALVAGASCFAVVPPGPNITTSYDGHWLHAKATWYGSPTGAGPPDNGGACGIKETNLPPYNSLTSCGNLPIFKDGKGCGSCFKIKCRNKACSRKPVTVFITDMNYDQFAPYHFDLSGTAFGALASPGRESELRRYGIIDLQFRRVRCRLAPGTKIAFHVEEGSNPEYLAVLVKFVAGDGGIVRMDLKQEEAGWAEWKPMRQSWGAIWRMDVDYHTPLQGPFSIRLASESGEVLVARHVIPADWKPKTVYQSNVQF